MNTVRLQKKMSMAGYYLTTVPYIFITVISLELVQLSLPFLLKSDQFQVLKQNNLIKWTLTK